MKKFFDMLRNERGEVGVKDDDKKTKDEEDIKDPDLALDEDHQDDETDDDDAQGDLEIDLDAEDDDGKQTKSDKAFAEMRIENKELKKTVDEMKSKIDGIAQPAPITPTDTQIDPNDPSKWTDAQWDELAKTDWKKAVDLRSEIKAKQQYQVATSTTQHNKVLEDSKLEVLRRHPELSDANSEKSKVFRNIVTANPEYVSDRKGPMHAMYEMENYMEKNMGYKREDIVKAEAKGKQEESSRRDTVALTSTAGRNMTEGNKVVLSQDEQEFCKLQEIDPKTYAANKKKLADTGGKGGIQL